ncbi:flavin reductase family protein [Jatrophihabitans sp.]|uniref:flavin reductase family protein n=1 Tax=Jatrophihabitans sp. TaxID=1932789 RepID=UPI002EEE54D4
MNEEPVTTFRPDLRGPDADLLRHVLGHYPTGVAVITAHTENGPVGMAMNSFTSLSLDPPLVLFCPAASSTTWPALREVGKVAINVLSAGQEGLSRKFATKAVDRFSDASWSVGENGAPLLHDALGWLECTVRSESPGGDHTVVIAEIERMNVHWEITEPLVFFRGRYYPGMTAAVESEPVPLTSAEEPATRIEPDRSVEAVR